MAWRYNKKSSATKRAFIAGLKAGQRKKKSTYSKYGRGKKRWN